VAGLGSFVLVIGGILALHNHGSVVFLIGLALVLWMMVGWWRDMLRESDPHTHTSAVQTTLRNGFALFIISEVMFFVAFFWAYFNASLYPVEATGGVWPPKGIHTIDPFRLPYFNTLLLLLSGTTITWAHHSLLTGDKKGVIKGLTVTIALGALFTLIQGFEYLHAPFKFKDGIYPSTFYMATGFHGFHVLVGTIFLIVCWFRARRGDYSPTHHVGFEAATWYWHFVDVVWLFLFITVYWVGSLGTTVGGE
jgi:cytochrome c oxidase subunit 3